MNDDLVRAVVRKFAGCGIDFEDLLQEGRLAYVRAERKFDAGYGVKFNTYASRVIQNRLIDLIRTYRPDVQLPDGLEGWEDDAPTWREEHEILAVALQQCTPLEQQICTARGEGYTYKEICARFNVTPKKVDNTMQKLKKLVKLNEN